MAVSKSAVAIGLAALFCIGWRITHPPQHLIALRSDSGSITFVDPGDAPAAPTQARAAPAASSSPPPSPPATQAAPWSWPFDNAQPAASAPADDAAGLDQRLVGAWNANLPTQWGEWDLDFMLRADGSYRTYNRGSFSPPDAAGKITARDGEWSAANEDHSTTSGRYAVLGDGLVRFTYANGAVITFRRLSLSPNF